MTNEELVKRIRAGETELYGELIEQNKGLMKNLYRRYCRYSSLEEDDAFSLGTLALINCVKRWDEAQGNKFSTLLGVAVCRSYLTFLRQDKRRPFTVSLDNDAEETNFHEVIEAPEKVSLQGCSWSDSALLKQSTILILNQHSERDKNISMDYFFFGLTQKELQEKYGISQSYISRIITKVRKQLLAELPSHGFQTADIKKATKYA